MSSCAAVGRAVLLNRQTSGLRYPRRGLQCGVVKAINSRTCTFSNLSRSGCTFSDMYRSGCTFTAGKGFAIA